MTSAAAAGAGAGGGLLPPLPGEFFFPKVGFFFWVNDCPDACLPSLTLTHPTQRIDAFPNPPPPPTHTPKKKTPTHQTIKNKTRSITKSKSNQKTNHTGELLKAPTRASLALAGDAHRLLFDLCMQPIRSRLRALPALPAWTQGDFE